ncbi:MAG: type I secretion system permease/ATPase [Alsobacter sp.]
MRRSPSVSPGGPALGRPAAASARGTLGKFLRSFRTAFIGLALISAVVNLLVLNGTVYMLEVYDRVLPSKSVPTLVGLSVLALALFAVQGLLEMLRGRALAEIGASLDESYGSSVYEAVVRLPLVGRNGGDGLQPFRDLDQIRNFLGGQGPNALFDLPWMPIYIAVAMGFHPWIGLTTLAAALLLTAIAILAEVLSRGPAQEAAGTAVSRNALALASRRNAETIRAMGMSRALGERWRLAHMAHLSANLRANHVAGSLASLSRTLRLILQSAVLGVGAYLAIRGEVSSGSMIACSVLLSRALSPVELAIAHWKGFVASRDAWGRLDLLLRDAGDAAEPLRLPAPRESLQLEGVFVNAPGGARSILADVSFTLKAGQGLGIIGPSASGKSTLARAITGVWPVSRGAIRIDGAELSHWSPEQLGPHVGYLPQDVELFAGTVAQNIARFEPDAPPEKIIAAARAAGVHELVLRLPAGYDTVIGEGGETLSGGQRQRLGLARALYGDPFVVVLDEPNSSLDAAGEEALTAAIAGVRERGAIVVIVAHRPSALAAVDRVLLLAEGRVQGFGPKDEIVARVVRPAGEAAPRLQAVAEKRS